MSKRILNVGVIGGGGPGAFIVHAHNVAIHFEGTRRITAGALRSNPEAALQAARSWPYPIKGYKSYTEMIRAQAKLPEKDRIDYALIVTPNHVHFDPAMKCIEAGISVFCEKPLTLNLDEAKGLAQAVKKNKIPFGVAHTYIGHWSSRFARHIVTSGLLGKVRWVDSYYLQGWLAGPTEKQGVQQAEWRVDPKQAGASCCGGDIGTHALQHLRYITGLEVVATRGFLEIYGAGRKLDDHFTTYNELSNGGKAIVRASQIAIGHKNDLGIEVNGEKGTLIWKQEDAEKVTILLPGQPDREYWRGQVAADDGFLKKLPKDLMSEPTLPPGHAEAFHDAFARLHRCFEADVRAYQAGRKWVDDGSKYASVEDGRKGIAFIEAAVKSSKGGGKLVRWK
jgi:predicted dehydrogenase